MTSRPYDLRHTAGGVTARIRARGSAVLGSPTINRGTAFTLAERDALGLTGLLPSGVSTLEGQTRRVWAQYQQQPSDLAKWVYLANLRDRNEVLFYRLLSERIAEMLPVVYTPTVGTAIERFSHEFRRSRGVYLSVDHPDQVETALRNTGLGPGDVDLLVATDSEGILGIGDQGVGGIEIAIGKLAVYTAAAGLHPRRMIPVVLDTGTDNLRLLNDPLYLGERHARVRDQRYDDLIDAYVTACSTLFPNAMLHWEDFGATNARRILDRYADEICTFNDDMQGTAAVVLAAVFSALRASGGTAQGPTDRDPWRRHRRPRNRRHAARPDDPRRPLARGGNPPVLPARPPGPAGGSVIRRCWTSRSPTPAPATRSPTGPTATVRSTSPPWYIGSNPRS